MILDTLQQVADSVLFEGYMLYPYRPSAIKNRKRFNFGTLWPREYAEAQKPEEAWSFHSEMLIEAGASCSLNLRLRFLQLLSSDPADPHSWEYGVVRARTIAHIRLSELQSQQTIILVFTDFAPEEKAPESIQVPTAPCFAKIELQAELLRNTLSKLKITISNETPSSDTWEPSFPPQSQAFTSAHLLANVEDGAFVSLLETPPSITEDATSCSSRGVFPVLIGEAGDRSTMLCSPIILYDYPAIAPESAANFCDGTEMDEMLALRVLTLTEAEKQEMRVADPHSRAILERTENLPEAHLMKLHGAIRGMQPVAGPHDELAPDPETPNGIQQWNPFEEKPPIEKVMVFGIELHKGDRVRIWPQKRADILDITVEGKLATIESIEQDLEDHIQFAVVFDDDPGKDMGLLRQAGHRFFFSPEEIEPLSLEAP
jgi:hypothetical protein